MKSHKGARNSFQGDTFEVGIALLTAGARGYDSVPTYLFKLLIMKI